MNTEERARELFDRFWAGLKELFVNRQWDGSPSRWPSTESYCASCLIDVNSAAGNDEKIQSHCMLPVTNPGSDSIDPEGLQAAAGGHGISQVQRPNDVPQDAWDSAVRAAANKIITNYPSLLDTSAPPSVFEAAGREPPAERAVSSGRLQEFLHNAMFQLDEQFEGSDNYIVDVYHDGGGTYALYTDRGKLYRHQIIIENDNIALGERIEVMEMHPPVQARTVIRQQDDGQYRWFSVSATAVLNRSGEIDSRGLFDSFIAHAEETGEYPIRQFYHQGSAFKTGQADFLARDEYCYITSGLFDDTPLGQAEVAARQREPEYWGDSIGFLPTAEPEMIEFSNGINLPVYREGINKEISTLPETEAASLFTRTEVTRMSLTGKALDILIRLFGDEEKAQQWLEENPNARNRAIEAGDLITRQGGEAEEDSPTSETETTEDNGQEQEVIVDDEVLNQLTQRVKEADFTLALVERVEATEAAQAEAVAREGELVKTVSNLAQRIEALEIDEDQKRQQWQEDLPARASQPARVVYRPRVARAEADVEVDEMAEWEKQKSNSNIPSY